MQLIVIIICIFELGHLYDCHINRRKLIQNISNTYIKYITYLQVCIKINIGTLNIFFYISKKKSVLTVANGPNITLTIG